MIKLNGKVTDDSNFFEGNDPFALAEAYGTPLYVYNERILRERCRDIRGLVKYPHFKVNYSMKANSNLAFLQVVRDEGLDVDVMSPGEIHTALLAGFAPSQIFYIANNVSREEMQFAIDKGIKTSVDSLPQLERYGQLNPGGRVAIRFNPGVGAGHHTKVVTGGKNTKFGVNMEYLPQVKEILAKYNLTLIGINQHIGSLFMEGTPYVQGAEALLTLAKEFPDLDFIDIGGGFGIPYKKQIGQARLDLAALGKKLDERINTFVQEYGREIIVKCEPGRYISAECGLLLGQVQAVKTNGERKYAGTDIGFNVLIRPAMYNSHHDIEIYRKDGDAIATEEVSVVGNICESGDILAADRMLPGLLEDDLIGLLDAGAYGFSMCSNYNNRLRPAEVFLRPDGSVALTRKRDELADLTEKYISLLD